FHVGLGLIEIAVTDYIICTRIKHDMCSCRINRPDTLDPALVAGDHLNIVRTQCRAIDGYVFQTLVHNRARPPCAWTLTGTNVGEIYSRRDSNGEWPRATAADGLHSDDLLLGVGISSDPATIGVARRAIILRAGRAARLRRCIAVAKKDSPV